MKFLWVALFFSGWIWSIFRGLKVSFLCAALNFTFPPISQIVFSIYEEEMRTPTIILIASLVVFYLGH
jgi:hypothetical protein